MLSTSAFAEVAALVGDPARANMLSALMDGRALTATELAHTAGITPQTASGAWWMNHGLEMDEEFRGDFQAAAFRLDRK